MASRVLRTLLIFENGLLECNADGQEALASCVLRKGST